MFNKIGAGILIVVLSAPATLTAGATEVITTPPPKFVDAGWKSIHRITTIRLDADGLGEAKFDFEYRATTRAGVDLIANETFNYDPNFEEMRFEGLETVKADGEVVQVDPRAIHDQPVHAYEQAPYIDDRRQKLVAYPDVEPGDVIRGKVITRTIKSPLGKGFSAYWAQRSDQSDEEFRFVIDAPAELNLQTYAVGVTETVRKENGRVIHTVDFPRTPPHVLTEAVQHWDVAPLYEVTTFASYAEFAKTISDLNASKSVPDEAIKRQVARITDGAADAREKAKRLSDWVAEHVRYVGIGLGNGGFISEPASATYAERYGDCKAHANLLKTMLAEVGIDAHLTLVNSEPSYRVPKLPVNDFDHEIVYLPAFDLYLDPTDPFGVFGAPLIELGGKPALDLATGEVRKIPLATPDDLKLGVETKTVMSPEGLRSGDTVLTGERNGESYRRWQTTNFCLCGDTKANVEAALANHHYSGSGDYVFGDAHKLGEPFAIKAHFAEDKPWDIQRFGAAIWVDTPVDPSASLSMIVHKGVVGRAAACFPVDYTETNTFTLPEGVKVLEVEDPLNIEDQISGRTALGEVNARISVRAEFTVDGGDIKLANHVRIAFDSPLCTGDILDHVDAALNRWDVYRYTWVPISTGAWYRPQNWLRTMNDTQKRN